MVDSGDLEKKGSYCCSKTQTVHGMEKVLGSILIEYPWTRRLQRAGKRESVKYDIMDGTLHSVDAAEGAMSTNKICTFKSVITGFKTYC